MISKLPRLGRFSKILLITAAVIVVLAAGLFVTYKILLRRAFPQTRGSITLSGPEEEIEVLRDSDGVPHIYASNLEDMFFANGFVHAQDRFWQMEFSRRIGSGRLSELFGESQLETDIYLRTLGFYEAAEREFQTFSDENRRFLSAYADGVNAYILDRKPARLGLEFALLSLQGVDVEIEAWRPEHTLTWARVMALSLGSNMDEEQEVVDFIRSAGTDAFGDLLAPYREDMPRIVEDGGRTASIPLSGGTGVGSNNWVISGELTESGTPVLANDMHLGVQMPSIWYEIGLHCSGPETYNVRGFSFPGVPGIISGHNEDIVWGVTNIGVDTQDLYLERVNPENPDQYLVNGSWAEMVIRYEEIAIQGKDIPYRFRVRSTRHGPVITDTGLFADLRQFSVSDDEDFPRSVEPTEVALRWTALEDNHILESVIAINRAQNYSDFRRALAAWGSPGQNFVYADGDGNIAYQMTGLTPIRKIGQGRTPVPGWNEDYEWAGFIPFDELPRVLNPPEGFIVTANNPVIGPDYPYFIGTDYVAGYRARRIVEMIRQYTGGQDGNDGKISTDEIQQIHGDSYNLFALEVIPYLKNLDFDRTVEEMNKSSGWELDDKEREALIRMLAEVRGRLLGWDGFQTEESPEAAAFGFFWLRLAEEVYRDQLHVESWPPSSQHRLFNSMFYLMQDPDNVWWDKRTTGDRVESRDEILRRSFILGVREAERRLGKDFSSWRWGTVHTVEFRNQTLGESGIGIIERIFNRGPFPLRAGATQVFQAGWSYDDPFIVTVIPSMRQIIDVGDYSSGLMIHPTGQSGHPGHPHYDDFIEDWRTVKYHSSRWERKAVEEDSRERLTLVPAE